MSRLSRWLSVATLSACLACGGGQAVKQGDTAAAPVDPDLEEVFQGIFNVPANAGIRPELLDPRSPEDAQDIVRSDNLALFPRADRLLLEHLRTHPEDLKNLTWHAQLFLAWADSAALTRKTLGSSVERLKTRQAQLDAVLADAAASAQDQERARADAAALGKLTASTAKVLATLDGLAAEKLAVAEQKTQAILAAHAGSYEGVRLAADLARLKEDWDGVDRLLPELQRLNPESNGLRFLRGMVAFQKDRDYAAAAQHLADAVAHDALFAKAQYYLALALINQRRFDEADAAIARTLEISPAHPFAHAVRQFVKRARKY